MLLRHSLSYLLFRGLPGVVNFAALAVFSRLILTAEYGYYAMAVSAIGLVEVAFSGWLRLSLLRFLPACQQGRESFLSTVLFTMLAAGVLLLGAGAMVALLIEDSFIRTLLLLSIALVWLEGWYGINLELARSQLQPARYGLYAFSRAVLAFLSGLGFALLGLGARGLLLGMACGMLAVIAGQMRAGEWRGVSWSAVDRALLREMMAYGFPLTATLAVSFVVSSSDRFMLAWLSGAESAGSYAVGCDMVTRAIGLLLVMVNLASYPLTVQALENSGIDAAREAMRRNALLLLALGLPVAIGMLTMAEQITGVVLGPDYRQTAIEIIPWIVPAALFANAKAFHADLGFQLGRSTGGQFKVMAIAALLNVALNLLLIPLYGGSGAAMATCAAYAGAFFLSWNWGKKIFPLPGLPGEWRKVLAAGTLMAISLWMTRTVDGTWQNLALQAALGGSVYTIGLLIFDVGGGRRMVAEKIAAVRKRNS